jgi:hypothetical protein
MSNSEYNLVCYCLRHMSSKEHIHNLYQQAAISYKQNDSYERLVKRFSDAESSMINLSIVKNYHRKNWRPAPKELHLTNLKTGLLRGHNWHGAMPSMLHLSLQKKVREHIKGNLSINELISIGADVMKHEYFMVCVHDLCETVIIEDNKNIIPPIGNKSISDFVFDGMPYDLKITNYFSGHTKDFVNNNKQFVAEKLLSGADVQRIRIQAKKTINNWGLNRFYVLVEDQDRWIEDPEEVLSELISEVRRLKAPFVVELHGIKVNVQLIAI